MNQDRIQQIEQHVHVVMARVLLPDLKLAHDFKHVDRVRYWALQIARTEDNIDMEVAEATALLHNIGLAYVQQRSQHAQVGAEVAARFWHDYKLFHETQIDQIAEAIRCHS